MTAFSITSFPQAALERKQAKQPALYRTSKLPVFKMTTSTPCIPLSKEDIAKAMGVTPRTIENWVKHEGMPAPSAIGNRVYWHPDIFYAWLQRRLRGPDACAQVAQVASRKRKSTGHEQLRLRNEKRIAAITGVSNG